MDNPISQPPDIWSGRIFIAALEKLDVEVQPNPVGNDYYFLLGGKTAGPCFIDDGCIPYLAVQSICGRLGIQELDVYLEATLLGIVSGLGS